MTALDLESGTTPVTSGGSTFHYRNSVWDQFESAEIVDTFTATSALPTSPANGQKAFVAGSVNKFFIAYNNGWYALNFSS